MLVEKHVSNKPHAVVTDFCEGLTDLRSTADISACDLPANPNDVTKYANVDNRGIESNLINLKENQDLHFEILGGTDKGKTGTALNYLSDKLELDEIYSLGSTILMEYSKDDQGNFTYAIARDNYRLGLIWMLVVIFGVFLVTVAGWAGWAGCKAIVLFTFPYWL